MDTDLNNTTGANFAQGRRALEQMFSNVLSIQSFFLHQEPHVTFLKLLLFLTKYAVDNLRRMPSVFLLVETIDENLKQWKYVEFFPLKKKKKSHS